MCGKLADDRRGGEAQAGSWRRRQDVPRGSVSISPRLALFAVGVPERITPYADVPIFQAAASLALRYEAKRQGIGRD